ncbi:MAG: homocysteine S-methyltransferase family protein [Ignavibacteriales bacterium]|nr:homocysteine S-methyltransferase family protein [Ignavibacteriales bacterium]
MNGFLERIASGVGLLADGAWGTMMQHAGLSVGECPELWNIMHPEKVAEIAAAYIQAGSEVIKTNSFGANKFRLQHYQLSISSFELARLAAKISRRAAGENIFVAGSVGPTGKIPGIDDIPEVELFASFSEQVAGLAEGGVDVLLFETFYSIEEMQIALSAAHSVTKLPVICSATYAKTLDGEFRTMTGALPEEFLAAAQSAGADVIGANCGFGIEDTIEVIGKYRECAPDAKLSAMANAGVPRIEGHAIVYPETPEYFASFADSFKAMNLSILGGCCGTTPMHISRLKGFWQ